MDVLLAAGLWSHTLQLLHTMIQKGLARHVSAPQHGSLFVAMMKCNGIKWWWSFPADLQLHQTNHEMQDNGWRSIWPFWAGLQGEWSEWHGGVYLVDSQTPPLRSTWSGRWCPRLCQACCVPWRHSAKFHHTSKRNWKRNRMTLIAETGFAASTFRSKERSFHLPWHSCRRWFDTSRQTHFCSWFFSTIFHNRFLQCLHFVSLHPGSSLHGRTRPVRLAGPSLWISEFSPGHSHFGEDVQHASTTINIAKYIMDEYILVMTLGIKISCERNSAFSGVKSDLLPSFNTSHRWRRLMKTRQGANCDCW